jgi:hypothetical protein
MEDRTARVSWCFAALLALLVPACGGGSSAAGSPTTTSSTPSRSAGAEEEVDPIEACVPACVTGYTEPGDLPVGVYETEHFFGGEMHVTFEDGWTSGEDSTGEFAIAPVATPENGIYFWEDIFPVENGRRVRVPNTAAGLLEWIRSSGRVDASEPVAGAIGELPAMVVDVTVAPDAENEEVGNPYCERRTCILFLGFPRWNAPWGIAGDQVQRLYLADVTYGGKAHVFVAVVYPYDEADLDAFQATADPVLETIRVPAEPA